MASSSDDFMRRAEHVIEVANQQAREFGNSYVDTEHILLALVADEHDVVAKLLSECGIKLDDLRESIKFVTGSGSTASEEWLGLTPRARRVVELAQCEACSLNCLYCGPEHLLLGILREGDGLAAAVLEGLAGTSMYPKVRDILQSKCPVCGGNVITATIYYPVALKDTIVLLEDVPAKVCSQCGELVEVQVDFDLKDRIRRLISSNSVPCKTLEVPVYDIVDIC